MAQNTQINTDRNFKKNIADLTKIPPNEFEKYFQDWMERDDVARTLQAKLRCDLIKNFNKTNLGKHIMSHTMSSTGGSTMRLTLSPLVLALNTLVAEFLYAQNCHFTLSVFCTEIPFRNTLPDFESMREFRFNDTEIVEIYEAVTGRKAIKKDLHKHVILNYEANPNMSLLLLIIKYLLKREPCEQLNRNAEVQTDVQEKSHKSTLIQVNEEAKQTQPQDENLHHINKYLQTLSQKLCEMTNEFEEFAKRKHESRPRSIKTPRSREYYVINKSLERITENMKEMAKAKRKNKRLTNIVKSIDGLTKEFGKCAKNFNNVTKMCNSEERKSKTLKKQFREQQTETEKVEKTYAEWIHEMRHTENGKKFLNRVEISLRKALLKHREQLENETEIKLKHLKSIIKLHYQQKLSKHLLQDPKINLDEACKCNDNIEKKLQQFELKQIELLEKLEQSSMELREAQQQQQIQNSIPNMKKKNNLENAKLLEKNTENQQREINTQTEKNEQEEDYSSMLRKLQISVDSINQGHQPENTVAKINNKQSSEGVIDAKKTTDLSKPLIENAQKQFLDLAKTIVEQGRSVDNIIYDAKLRIQQLENESNQLEQNFQSYLERRKQNQELELNSNNPKENLSATSSFGKIISLAELCKIKSTSYEDEVYDEIDEEFRRMKEHLRLGEERDENKPKSNESDSSTSSLEIRNAILEAKLKFFEHEHTIRQCVEQDDQIRSGNLLQKQLEKYPELNEINEYFNSNFGKHDSEPNLNGRDLIDQDEDIGKKYISETKNLELMVKDITLCDDQCELVNSPLQVNNSQSNEEEKSATSARRKLFPLKEQKLTVKPSVLDKRPNVRYHEPIAMRSKNLKRALEFNFNPTLDSPVIERTKPVAQVEGTTELIKQSMAKMQQLFEKETQSKETLRDLVNDVDKQREIDKSKLQKDSKPATVLLTPTVTKTTPTPSNSSENLMENCLNLNPISTTSMPSLLNLTSETEESIDLAKTEFEVTADTIIDMVETNDKSSKEQEKIISLGTSSEQEENDPINETSETESSELNFLKYPSDKATRQVMPLSTSKEEDKEEQINEISDSTSEINSLISHDKEITQTTNTVHGKLKQFRHITDLPKFSHINLSEPDNYKEIGEVFSASNESFASISTHSSYKLNISTGDKRSGKEIDDSSESEFWA